MASEIADAPLQPASLQTPYLRIDLDRARANIARTLALLGGDVERWRPHVKTAKLPRVMRLFLDAGLRRFKCATTREAAVLLSLFEREPIDLVVAMGLRGANLERAAMLARQFPQHRVSALSEDGEHAASIAGRFPELGIFVDLDPGFGRSGVGLDETDAAIAVAMACGASLRGLHSYEGQMAGLPPEEREALADRIHPRLADLADRVAAACPEARPAARLELITSGTPAFPHAVGHPAFAGRLHRVSPGTVVYADLATEALGLGGYDFAASVVARVISRPGAGRATLDAGSKALDAAAGDPCARVLGWEHLEVLRPSEEHLPLRAGGAQDRMPALGDLVTLVPRHVCPTVNLADEAALVEGGRIVEVAPVTARGHETRLPPSRA